MAKSRRQKAEIKILLHQDSRKSDGSNEHFGCNSKKQKAKVSRQNKMPSEKGFQMSKCRNDAGDNYVI